ncbi:MAG: DUF4292 domain-containing protein [Deltaproteobacteria bacterium]|nr:DUF4292 domain-containing protein [Deltaproteobacteria bacterium]
MLFRLRRAGLALILAGAAIAVPACRAPEGPPPVPESAKLLTPEAFTRRQAERASQVASLRAFARVQLSAPRGKFGFSEAINVVRPRQVRLDTIGPFSRVFSVLASDGARLVFLSPDEKRAYTGSPTPENLARFLPFTLDPEDIVAILLGGVPEPSHSPFVSQDRNGRDLLVRSENRSGSVSLATLDGRTLQLKRLQIMDPTSALAAVVDYAGWKDRGGIAFPSEISIRVPSRDVLMAIRFEEMEPNARIDAGLFSPGLPPGFETVPMTELPPPIDYRLTPGLSPEIPVPPDAGGGSAGEEASVR